MTHVRISPVLASVLILSALWRPVPASAQSKFTVSPAKVDAAAPAVVTVKGTTAADTDSLKKTTGATVGGAAARAFAVVPDGVQITPPIRAVGKYPVVLAGPDATPLPIGELEYTASGSPPPTVPAAAATPAATTPAAATTPTGPSAAAQTATALNATYWFPALIAGAFLLVVLPFVMAIGASVYRGRSPLNAEDRPLGLPVGSVRSILAYTLVVYLGFYVLVGVLSGSGDFKPPDFLLGIVATVIGFYFGTRSEHEGETADSSKGNVRGVVTLNRAPAVGAAVKFTRSADGAQIFSRITDTSGRFELAGVPPGQYKVAATLTGATPSAEQAVTVAAGSDHEIAIELKTAAP